MEARVTYPLTLISPALTQDSTFVLICASTFRFASHLPDYKSLVLFATTNPEVCLYNVCHACSDFTPCPKSDRFDQKRLRKVDQGVFSCPEVCMTCLVDGFQPQICQFWREKILKSKYSSAPDRVPCPVYYRQLPGLLADKRWILMWGWLNKLKHWNSVWKAILL